METLIQQIINGLSVGAVYALIAVGYTMVYGVLRFINFAHSDVFTFGAWIAFALAGAALALTILVLTRRGRAAGENPPVVASPD